MCVVVVLMWIVVIGMRIFGDCLLAPQLQVAHLYVCGYVNEFGCVDEYTCACVCTHTCEYARVNICKYKYIGIYVCMYI